MLRERKLGQKIPRSHEEAKTEVCDPVDYKYKVDSRARPGLSREAAKSGAKALAMNSEESELMRWGQAWRRLEFKGWPESRGRGQSLQREPLACGPWLLPPSLGGGGPEMTLLTNDKVVLECVTRVRVLEVAQLSTHLSPFVPLLCPPGSLATSGPTILVHMALCFL